MKVYGFGQAPVPTGPPVFGKTLAESGHGHVTTVHVHEDADIPDDLTLESLDVEQLQVTEDVVLAGSLQTPFVDTAALQVGELGISLGIVDEYEENVRMHISNRFLPVDVSAPQGTIESTSGDNTINRCEG